MFLGLANGVRGSSLPGELRHLWQGQANLLGAPHSRGPLLPESSALPDLNRRASYNLSSPRQKQLAGE